MAEVDPIRSRLEERVFIDAIEDILRATSGLHYQKHLLDPEGDENPDGVYAMFTFETNPAYKLEVAIELSRDGFRVWINGEDFFHPVENRRRIDRWIERRCRDVEQLVKGDLKIEVETIFGRYLSTGLYAGCDNRWVEIAERDEGWGWIGLGGWLLPFGLLPLRTRETEYRGWLDLAGASEPPSE
jgi:hypothetical protein